MARLKAVEPEFRAAGLAALYLFGSRARGDQRDDSDVDLAFDVSPDRELSFSLMDQAGLILRLREVLGGNVDLIERRCFRPRIRQEFERDVIQVFG